MNIKVIGIGGVGGLVLPVLCRFLNYESKDTVITLIDGDSYEEHNQRRQAFQQLGNKAEVKRVELAGLYGFDNITIYSVPEFVTEDNVYLLLREGDIIFLCVDNYATRKLVSDRCEELENAVVISGGNELTDGNIQVFLRKGGQNVTLALANRFHEEVMFPSDQNLSQQGCDARNVHEPQLLITNNFIAALMLNAFYSAAIGVNTKPYDEAYADIVSNTVRPVDRRNGSI